MRVTRVIGAEVRTVGELLDALADTDPTTHSATIQVRERRTAMSELSNYDTGYADHATPTDGLRAWAQGLYPTEAGIELLIRAGFAQTWRPWIFASDWDDRYGIEFDTIPGCLGGMSSGESRFLLAAASIGTDAVDVPMGDVVCGIDRHYVDLILAGIAHAAGTHEDRPMHVDPETRRCSFGDPYPSLHSWPTTTEKR